MISCDGHVGPPIEAYRDYCPKKYLSLFDEQVKEVRSRRNEATGMPDFDKLITAFLGGQRPDPKTVAAMERVSGIEGAWDPIARLRDLDESGIAGEVIFHGHENGEPMPLVAEGFLHPRESWTNRQYDAVGCRIYNRWIADFIQHSDGRQVALAYVPIADVDAAVEEVKWAHGAGLKGINFPAPRHDLPCYYDGTLDPLYDVCAQLDMPLHTHAGGGELYGYKTGQGTKAMLLMERSFIMRRGVWQLLFSGVFDRFPRLKYVLTEVRAQWIPEMVRDLDAVALNCLDPAIRASLPQLPSEYWTKNFFVGASFMSHDEACMFPARGTSQMMWGSDYPHLEGTHPYTRLAMQCTFRDIAPEHVAQMIGLTAANLYGFDMARMRTIADSIGPTVAELSQWSGEMPGDEYIGDAFRQHTDWPALADTSRRG